ncbi:nuclear pore complex protein Nup50 isoform X2 [Brachyistius frenatus]|uniref:nuclear pore complex protein Nup50 isoform X2 n=1 Tax=Brachyistius frenatus TaxID=100188 RepID=UPI0037E76EE6
MAKRIADKELTDRNWDQEEEGEEAGTFSVASEDVLKNRAIKRAKRRNTGAEGEVSGAFKGFKGFSMTAASGGGASTPTAFSGFGNGGGFKGLGGLTNGNSGTAFSGFSSPPGSTAAAGLTFNGLTSARPAADITAKQTNGSAPGAAPSSSGNKEYSRQLTALNCSVRDWITKHVNDNPLCDLNPIFRDYERHLASIERQYGSAAAGGSEDKKQAAAPPPPSSSSSSSSAPNSALFSFSKSDESSREKSAATPAGVTFNFGQKVDGSVLSALGSKDVNGDEETEEPPKPDVKEVKEDDAFYSKKCKMFYKKEAEFKEKGVGTLHLKETDEGKTQMIIRADTNLGNILLNVLVNSSMPCSRLGKNNVMVVCVPNPPVDDKNASSPVPFLIRVKTSEDADELHKLLEEKKG